MPLIVFALVFFAAVTAAAMSDTLSDAERELRSGAYASAEQIYRKLLPKLGPVAHLGLADVLLQTGRYAEARVHAQIAAKNKRLWAQATIRVGEIALQGGDLDAAQQSFSQVVKRGDHHYKALVLLGATYHFRGDYMSSRRVLDRFYDDFDAGRIDRNSADQLTYLGLACRYTDNFQDAADAFADATAVAPTYIKAWLHWAETSWEKHDIPAAKRQYKTALALNPQYLPALVGLGRISLEQDNDVSAALTLADRAAAVDPESADLQALLAEVALDAGEHQRAREQARATLKRHRHHAWALGILAASHLLRDEKKAYASAKAQILAVNPHSPSFFRVVMTALVRQHRYADAVTIGRKAIELNPNDSAIHAVLGRNYLRLGDEKRGLVHLRRAWNGDRYDHKTYRLLNLYEDVLAKNYVFVSSTHFRLRVHRLEAPVLARVVIPFLERTFSWLVKRYGAQPAEKIQIELYRDERSFAVRSSGLPHIDVRGACFGNVVAAVSPMRGLLNWAQLLAHELSHVFSIQLSRARIPRWLSEGLAEADTAAMHAEWRRAADTQLLYDAIRNGRFAGIAELGRIFSQAQTTKELLSGYLYSRWFIAWLVENFGTRLLKQMLQGLAGGYTAPEAIESATGVTSVKLERRFAVEQKKRLVRRYGNGMKLRAYEQQFSRGQTAYRKGDLSAAERYITAALGFESGRAEPYQLLTQIYQHKELTDKEVVALKQFVLHRPHEYTAARRLVWLLKRQGDFIGIRTFGLIATHIQPCDAWVRETLADAYLTEPNPQREKAIWQLDMALLCNPKQPDRIRDKLRRVKKRRVKKLAGR